MILKTFADRMAHRRKALGLSIHELVVASGIRENTLRNWESGVTPSAEHLPALATALKTTIDYLLTGAHTQKTAV